MQDVPTEGGKHHVQARRRTDNRQLAGGGDVVGLPRQDDLVRAGRRGDVRKFGDPASASWPTLSGRIQISPTSLPRTSGIISGRGTTPSPSEAVYVSFATPTKPFHIRASTQSPLPDAVRDQDDPATQVVAASGK
ncbi:hypothetical protein [Streptomyces lavendulocolor]|uniref:hypothetical protein n=1 Tax=Streptomyces lavendulocolor TaxID=67316 RepID=UPI003C2C05BD